MQVEHALIESIVPYEFNARRHDDEQIGRIARSIKEFGFNQPIVVDETSTVLVGHGRLLAAQSLGLATVPVVKLEKLSEAQKKTYRILDNKLQNDSTWDFNNLELDLGFIEDNGIELEPWGLDDLLIKPTLLGMVDIGPEDRDSDYSRTYTLTREQAEIIDAAIESAKAEIPEPEGNAAGAALTHIATYWKRRGDG